MAGNGTGGPWGNGGGNRGSGNNGGGGDADKRLCIPDALISDLRLH